MKWVKTQNGNIIRLGAISEFILDEKSIQILIGEVTEQGAVYDCHEQLSCTYNDLMNFLTDTDIEIFSFPKPDNNLWLKNYKISELNPSVREYNACLRAGIETVYDLMPSLDGFERVIRGIGSNAELYKKRDEFVMNKLKKS